MTTPNTPNPATTYPTASADTTTPPDPDYPTARGTAATDPIGAAEARGSLEIHPAVVRKVAAHAVRLVPGAEPSAAVRVGEAGGGLELAVRLALHYPAPIRPVAADVRRRVTEEVERITGFRVRSVAVTVSALRAESLPRVG
ncbi:Asp23/Gls24 family envelope stress response protein [Saccharothrix stipae]